MSYGLSFSPEFFCAPDESERAPAVNVFGQPISVHGAIRMMGKRDWNRACRANGLDPKTADVSDLEQAVRDIDSCRNIDATGPIEVYVTPDHDVSVNVYNGPECEPGAPNLDGMTADALMQFWHRFNRPSRKDAERLVGRRRGFTTLCGALAGYASNKATAMRCRERGDIQAATIYETIADGIYDRLPADLKW
jgi:hypothetical protein